MEADFNRFSKTHDWRVWWNKSLRSRTQLYLRDCIYQEIEERKSI